MINTDNIIIDPDWKVIRRMVENAQAAIMDDVQDLVENLLDRHDIDVDWDAEESEELIAAEEIEAKVWTAIASWFTLDAVEADKED